MPQDFSDQFSNDCDRDIWQYDRKAIADSSKDTFEQAAKSAHDIDSWPPARHKMTSQERDEAQSAHDLGELSPRLKQLFDEYFGVGNEY
jgi:hypothetical protein